MKTLVPGVRIKAYIRVAVLILLVLGIAWSGGGRYLLQRQIWMDEVHSWLLIQEPSTQRSLQALADGVDFNPPTYILLARQLHYVPGKITESRLRWLSLSLMLLALVGIFVLLARRFPWLVCVASTLMMASSVHLIHQSAEIRFYPLWCAACAWLCVVMDVPTNQQPRLKRVSNVAAVLLAGVISTTHYFGILTLGLICFGAILGHGVSRGRRWMIMVIALTGGLCLSGCLPFLIGQRAALTQATWVSSPTVDDSIGFLRAMFPSIPLIICGVVFVISTALRRPEIPDTAPEVLANVNSTTIDNRTLVEQARQLAPCLLLALMPLMIVLLSWTVQPALVVRYAVTGILGFGAIFAILLSRCGMRLQGLMVVIAAVMFWQSVNTCAMQWREIDQARDELVTQLQRLPNDGPIVFEDRTVSMPVLHLHPELLARCSLIDFTDNQLSGDSRLRIVQRDVGQRIAKWYPVYTMTSLNSLSEVPRFYVVPYVESQSASLLWPANYQKTQESPAIERYEAMRP